MKGKQQTFPIPPRHWTHWRREITRQLGIPPHPPGARPPAGWSVSARNPAKALQSLPGLRLKPGFRFMAYQFHTSSGEGNGIVWAVPEARRVHRIPEPANPFFSLPPRPPDALPAFMDAVEGDGSPASYAQASLLFRELLDLGSPPHATSWKTHHLITADPWSANGIIRHPNERPTDKVTWHWKGPSPADWHPRVIIETTRIRVAFHTYAAFGIGMIFSHVDTFQPDSCVPDALPPTVIATGQTGSGTKV